TTGTRCSVANRMTSWTSSAEAALTRAIAPSRGQNRASSLEWASTTSGSVVREPGLRRDPRSASAAGSKTGTLSSRVTASAGESAAVGRLDFVAPRIDGDAGMVGRCRWSRLSWRPAGAFALFQRRLQVIGRRCGLEDEGHDAGGDHGRPDDPHARVLGPREISEPARDVRGEEPGRVAQGVDEGQTRGGAGTGEEGLRQRPEGRQGSADGHAGDGHGDHGGGRRGRIERDRDRHASDEQWDGHMPDAFAAAITVAGPEVHGKRAEDIRDGGDDTDLDDRVLDAEGLLEPGDDRRQEEAQGVETVD